MKTISLFMSQLYFHTPFLAKNKVVHFLLIKYE